MRVAIVHDFLYTFGGAEQVLKQMLAVYPDATVYSLFDVLKASDREKIGIKKSNTSFLQKMPFINKRHRLYMPLMPIAIEQLDLSDFDLIISSSYAVAKGIITGPDQLHISYIHSPMRYAWDLQHQYLRESNKDKGTKGVIARSLLHYMRLWDARTAHGPNSIICNSHFVARRIKKIYGREAKVIYPPVRVTPLYYPSDSHNRGKYYFTCSRLVPYKNVHLIAEAFKHLPDLKLVIAGTGPELARIKAVSGPNVKFLGFVSDSDLKDWMRHAQAFIFAAEEDFGIVPLEAQSVGTPVIALGRGGAKETIVTTGDHPTGMFFDQPLATDIASVVQKFLLQKERFTAMNCYKNALRFSEERFRKELTDYVKGEIAQFESSLFETHAKPLTQENSI